jgi:hypothetical protein
MGQAFSHHREYEDFEKDFSVLSVVKAFTNRPNYPFQFLQVLSQSITHALRSQGL